MSECWLEHSEGRGGAITPVIGNLQAPADGANGGKQTNARKDVSGAMRR